MRKLLKAAAAYAAAAIICGVFDREFTKWNDFTGVTPLAYVHVHLFVFGMLLFLILASLARDSGLEGKRAFKAFFIIHNIALPWTAALMLTRGILAVEQTALSHGADVALSFLAGLGHLGLTVGLVFLFLALFQVWGQKGSPEKKPE
jgi:ABC-type sugar transport system permease subunit